MNQKDKIEDVWIKFVKEILLPNHCGYLRFEVKKLITQIITQEREQIKTDLLKIVEEGELEDLRREVIRYFKQYE